jgi:glycosyltransferase involved in cell wall biosynthesis
LIHPTQIILSTLWMTFQCILNFHPYAYDSYGMTIVEAAACGVPSIVLSTNIGAVAPLKESCFHIHLDHNVDGNQSEHYGFDL